MKRKIDLNVFYKKLKEQNKNPKSRVSIKKGDPLIKRKTTLKKTKHNVKKVERTPPQDNFVFDNSFYKNPSISLITTPPWFVPRDDVEVSIVVPLFRSREEILSQIRNWDLLDDTSHEIIYVDDACPHSSKSYIVPAWEISKNNFNHTAGRYFGEFKSGVGKIISLSHNSGYSNACNVGAEYASGKYLVFLNADTVPTKNWLKNLIFAIKEETAGIVGNLQLKMDGSIDSAGSEWMWDNWSFEHIGRNVYQGKRLTSKMYQNTMPEDLKIRSERQMVTGCCFTIEKSLFNKLGGFDISYRIGYWEDSDLCMRIKEVGKKIFYEPSSIIYHKCGHSKAGFHPFVHDNVKLFYDRWVYSGKLKELLDH